MKLKQKKIKFEPKIKFMHNINTQIKVLDFHKKYNKVSWQNPLLHYKEKMFKLHFSIAAILKIKVAVSHKTRKKLCC